MKKRIIILTILFLFTSIIFGQKTDKQESKNKLTKGGGLEIKAELFNEKDIEKGMRLQLISSKDKSKTFSFTQKDCIKSKDKITFQGIEKGNYDIYLNIMGFGVKHIKDIEIKKGKISKAGIVFNKNSKCGVKGKVTIALSDKYKWVAGNVKIKAEGKSAKIYEGKSLVDKKGNFKIIDMNPGTYILDMDYKIKKIKDGGIVTCRSGKICKIKENRISKEIFVAKSPPKEDK